MLVSSKNRVANIPMTAIAGKVVCAGSWRFLEPNAEASKSMMDVALEVVERHGFSVADLRGPYRHQKLSHARQEAFYEVRRLGKYSFPQIGRFFNRDHTTIIHGVRAHHARMAKLKEGNET